MHSPWLTPWRRGRRVLGLNARNLLYVHGLNPRHHFPLADDKVMTKTALDRAGVPTTRTLAVLSNLLDVKEARSVIDQAGEFVLKPARGRQGTGIVVITGRDGDAFIRSGGQRLSWDDLRRAMGDILFGVHGVGRADQVLIETRVRAHPGLEALARFGLPDIRVILLQGEPAMSMMRVPTLRSAGRANLHQGAIGIALRLTDGQAFRAVIAGHPLEAHPDSGAPLTGFRVPLWESVIDVARRAGAVLPLPYLGVDIVLDAGGALVMEVNVRPGLEIQNVNRLGLRHRLSRLMDRSRRQAGS